MEVFFNFTFNNWEGILLALIPALLNWGILIYILSYLPKNRVCYTFSLFVASLATWQTSDVLSRISVTGQTALLWNGLLGIGVLLIVPAGLHFVFLFTERKKFTNSALTIFLLYFPVIFFFTYNIVTTTSYSIKYYPIWGWEHKAPYNNIILLESLWVSGLALAIIIILFCYAFKIRQDREKYFQTLLIATGFTLPTIQGIITQVIFPMYLKIPQIPISSTFMSVFSISTLIALTRFKLFKISPSIAASTILEIIKDIVIVVNPQERLEFINSNGAEVLGINQRKVENLFLKDIFPKDRQFYEQFIQGVWDKALKGKYTESFETFLLKQDNIEIPVSLSVVPIPIAINYQALPSILLVARDISEPKRINNELEKSLSLLQATVESTNDGILVVDRAGKVSMFNQKFLKLWNIPVSIARIKGDDNKLIEIVLAQLKEPNVFINKVKELYDHPEMESQDVLEFKDGRIFDRFSQPQRMGDTIVGRVWSFRDITESKKSEIQILEQAELLDKAQDAIIVRDLDYKVIYWNKSAERLYGWTKGEVLGKNITEQFYDVPSGKDNTSDLIEARNTVLEKGEWIGELTQLTKFGFEIIVQSRSNLIHDKSGRAKSILTVNTDITEKKLIEAQFLRAQRMEGMGTLTGGIAHDLNNVLAPIMMAVEVLKMNLSDNKRNQILSTLESSVKRGSDIIKQLLIFARGEVEKEHTTVQIHQLIWNITQIINRTFPKSIMLITSIPDNLWSVTGDITQLEQMLLNLCVNARDAMPDGGIMTISAENIFIDKNFAKMNIDAKVGHYVSINVIDTGTGISPDVIHKIFEPFFTTKEVGKGTGLGLSSLTGIIKSHGGFVNLSSEIGKGTQFKVYLPSEKSIKIEQTVDEQSELLRGNGELILVIDDDVSIIEILKTTLETFGYNVLTARNGMEAIEIYKENKNTVKVILTDVSMPVMDGLNTTKALQQIDPLVKVIIVSGLTTNKQAAEVLGNNETFLDGTSFLQKPYTTADLLKKIKDILNN